MLYPAGPKALDGFNRSDRVATQPLTAGCAIHLTIKFSDFLPIFGGQNLVSQRLSVHNP